MLRARAFESISILAKRIPNKTNDRPTRTVPRHALSTTPVPNRYRYDNALYAVVVSRKTSRRIGRSRDNVIPALSRAPPETRRAVIGSRAKLGRARPEEECTGFSSFFFFYFFRIQHDTRTRIIVPAYAHYFVARFRNRSGDVRFLPAPASISHTIGPVRTAFTAGGIRTAILQRCIV